MGLRFLTWLLVFGGLLGSSVWGQPTEPAAKVGQPEQPTLEQVKVVPASISLAPGELWSVPVDEIKRVAVGDPEVVDVTVVSPNEVLLQGKAAGTTNLLLWDRQGQHVSNIEVVDRTTEALEGQLRQLVAQLGLPGVQVKRENNKLFLIGDVPRQADADRLEQMLASFKGVTNLAQVLVPTAAPVAPLLVKLAVQVIDISRKDLERLGVNWGESLKFTEPEVSDLTGSKALFGRWGTSLTRGSLPMTLNALVQQNRARVLAEPKLVTASGKEASSFIGVEVPVISTTSFGTSTSSVSASIEFRKTGVLLKMTPNVNPKDPDRKITTAMEAEVSDIDRSVGLSVPVGSQTIVVPGFKVRKANTEVTTISGETIMIAGLLQAEDSRNLSQVPALGSMPVLGRLFRSPEAETTQRELVIAVTPELVGESEVTTEKAMALEQALSVAEVTASVENPVLRYALQVQERIAKSLRYPQREKELSINGQIKLRVHLLRDGTLKQATISESSGFESFDQAALKAAESQSPFPPFPSDVAQQELWLELPVLFRP